MLGEEETKAVAAAPQAAASAPAVDEAEKKFITPAKMVAPLDQSFPATADNIPSTGEFVSYPRDEVSSFVRIML